MKRVLLSISIVLVLMSQVAFAEVQTMISEISYIKLDLNEVLKIEGTKQELFISSVRQGYTKSGTINGGGPEYYGFNVGLMNLSEKSEKSIAFTTKELPYFLKDEMDLTSSKAHKYYPEIDTLGTNIMVYKVNQNLKSFFASARKVTFVIPTKQGNNYSIELPQEYLKEIQYFFSCNLKEEREKGF